MITRSEAIVRIINEDDPDRRIVIRACGTDNVLVELGEITLDLNYRARIYWIEKTLREMNLDGLIDVSPGVRSFLITFDALKLSLEKLIEIVIIAERESRNNELKPIPSRRVYMPIAFHDQKCLSYIRRYMENSIDEKIKEQARQQFASYKRIEAIENDSFDDDVWVINNEVNRRMIQFEISEFKYRRFMEPWVGCSMETYKECIKVYVALLFGQCGIEKLGEVATSFRNLAGYSADEVVHIHKNVGHITELLRLLPSGSQELERVIEFLDEHAWEKRIEGGQRELAEFNSYIRFNSALREFWEQATREEKLTYFPVYLWWNLTAILPLRPSELIRTPRHCLRTEKGKDLIIIRRSRLKGVDRLSYRIDDDYDQHTYPISKVLADEIKWYLDNTDEAKLPDNDTLFSIDAQNKSGIIATQYMQKPHYSYINLVTCLHNFIKNEIPGDAGVVKLRLGDTRHIAMMNLIISGGSPSICKELAGHSGIEISSHYYSNFTTLIESAVYEEHRHAEKSRSTEADLRTLPRSEILVSHVSINGGWCMSKEMERNSVKDCLKSIGRHGEVGECKNCRYYSLDATGTHIDVLDCEKSKEEVREDSWFLMSMIEAVRKGMGCEGDLQSAITRLQHSCAKYRSCLEYEYSKGVL